MMRMRKRKGREGKGRDRNCCDGEVTDDG